MSDPTQPATNEHRPPASVPKRSRAVRETLRALKRGDQDNNGGVRTSGPEHFRVRAHPGSLERVGSFLDLLIAAAKARGFTLVEMKNGLGFAVDDEQLTFEVYQVIKRARHFATVDEERRLERWNTRHAYNFDFNTWESRPSIPLWDFEPSGEMKIEIGGWPRPRTCTHVFTDSRSRKIEDRIPEILESFAIHAEFLKECRAKEELRLQAHKSRRLVLERQRFEEALEQERLVYLDRKLEGFRRRADLQFLVETLSQTSGEDTPRHFIEWARDHLEQLDLVLSPTAIKNETKNMPAFQRNTDPTEGPA